MEAEKYTEEQLTAYLDGEVDTSLSDEIRLASDSDAELRQRIEALTIQKQELASAMDQLLDIAPEMPALPVDLQAETENSVNSLRYGFNVVAACFLILFVGGFTGYMLNNKPETGWKDYVAAYHFLYVNSTLSSVETNEAIQTAELQRISEAIARPIALENLTQVAGLDYKRAQILGFKGKPLAQMTFLSKMGTPVALCIIRNDADTAGAPQALKLEGMASATWNKDGYAYLLIGGGDQKLITEAANEFAKIL